MASRLPLESAVRWICCALHTLQVWISWKSCHSKSSQTEQTKEVHTGLEVAGNKKICDRSTWLIRAPHLLSFCALEDLEDRADWRPCEKDHWKYGLPWIIRQKGLYITPRARLFNTKVLYLPCYTIPCNNSTYILCHLSACVAFCPSTCPLVSPPQTPGPILLYRSSYFPSGQLSEGHRGYYLDMRYTMSALDHRPPPHRSTSSLSFTSSPVFSLVLYQVIGVLIAGHRACRVTDGPAGIMWSICIIGVLALFISLPVCLSRQHPCLRTYSHTCARTHGKDSWLFLSPFVCKRIGDIFSPGWAACALIDHMEMEIGRSSFWVMRIGAYLSFESLNQFGEARKWELFASAARRWRPPGTPVQHWLVLFSLFNGGRTQWWQRRGLGVCSECQAFKETYIYVFQPEQKASEASRKFSVLHYNKSNDIIPLWAVVVGVLQCVVPLKTQTIVHKVFWGDKYHILGKCSAPSISLM